MRNLTYLAVSAVTLAILFSASAPLGAPQEDGESVMLVHLVFRDGQWSIGPEGVRVLPCRPPRQLPDARVVDVLVRVKDEAGAVVLERNLLNPRIRLAEPEAGGPPLLEETSVILRLPVKTGMQRLEFFDPTELEVFREADTRALAAAKEGMEPSVVVDVGQAVRSFAAEAPAAEAAPCREFEYKPDQREK